MIMAYFRFLLSYRYLKKGKCYFSDGSSNIAFYVVIAGLVIIQAITVSIVVYQRRRMSDLLRTKHPSDDIKSQGQITTTNYDNLAFAEESHEYVSIDSTKRD